MEHVVPSAFARSGPFVSGRADKGVCETATLSKDVVPQAFRPSILLVPATSDWRNVLLSYAIYMTARIEPAILNTVSAKHLY